MSWVAETPTPKVTINGAEVEYTSPSDLKMKVIEKAKELGMSKFDVLINGEKVLPEEFEGKVSELADAGKDISIEIVTADKGA